MTTQSKRGRPRKTAEEAPAKEATEAPAKKASTELRDRKGRQFHPRVHEHKGGEPVVKDGFLVVKDRSARPAIGATQKLDAKRWQKKHPGMKLRYVNDVESRVLDFEDSDWIPVPGEGGSQIRKKVGHGLEAVLMMKPEEWFEADQAVKQRAIASTEKSQQQLGDGEYIPEGYKKVVGDDSPLA